MADPEKVPLENENEDEMSTDDEAPATDAKSAASALLQDPAVLAALQGKLGSIVGQNSGYIQSLPPQVKRRLKALKKVQLEATNLEAKFYEEVHQLEYKYHKVYEPLYAKRTQIIEGEYEPNDDECEWPSEDEDEEEDKELSKDLKDKIENEKDDKAEEGEKKTEDVKGIPSFWLTIFKNVEMLAEMVQDADEPVLEKLQDITVSFTESCSPMGFTLYFHFKENDYFTNTVLTKEYEMKCEPMKDDPFSFEGPEIVKCKGCTINWKKGMNLTIKNVKKKQKHKSKGSVRTITVQVKADSFFNFFDPPAVPDDPQAVLDEDTQAILTADFEIGHYIRERIVPRAVLYFTGEALEESEFDSEEESDEDGDEDEEESDPDFDPKEQTNPECKQQ